MNIPSWNHETRQAYVGTLIYSLLGILAAILTPFVTLRNTADAVASIAGAGSSGMGLAGWLLILVQIGIVAGYVMFFLAVKDLKEITEGKDKADFQNVFLAIIFSVIAAILNIFHWWIISGILSLVACILLLIAYSSLKKSATITALSPEASAGFGRLFVAELLLVIGFAIGIVIGWIPFIGLIGHIINAVLGVVAWILILLGWKAVATPVAVPGEAPVEEKPLFDTVKEVFSESVDEAKDVAKDLGEKAKDFGEKAKDAFSKEKTE